MGSPEAEKRQESGFENAMALVKERLEAYINLSYMTSAAQTDYVALGVQLDKGAEEDSFSRWKENLSEDQIEKFEKGIGLDIWYVAFQMAKALSGTEKDFGIVLRRASSLLKLGNILAFETYECAMSVREEVSANIQTKQGKNKCRVMCLAHALGFNPEYTKNNGFRNKKLAEAVREDLRALEGRTQAQVRQEPTTAPEPEPEVDTPPVEESIASFATPITEAETSRQVADLMRKLQEGHVNAESFGNPSYYDLLVEQIVDAIEEKKTQFVQKLRAECEGKEKNYRQVLKERVRGGIQVNIKQMVEAGELVGNSQIWEVYNQIGERMFKSMAIKNSYKFLKASVREGGYAVLQEESKGKDRLTLPAQSVANNNLSGETQTPDLEKLEDLYDGLFLCSKELSEYRDMAEREVLKENKDRLSFATPNDLSPNERERQIYEAVKKTVDDEREKIIAIEQRRVLETLELAENDENLAEVADFCLFLVGLRIALMGQDETAKRIELKNVINTFPAKSNLLRQGIKIEDFLRKWIKYSPKYLEELEKVIVTRRKDID